MYNSLKNNTTLIGFVGADARLIAIAENRHLVVFPFGVNDDYKNTQGEIVRRTIWYTVQKWYNIINPTTNEHTFKKGLPFVINGKLSAKPFIKEENNTIEDNKPKTISLDNIGIEYVLLLQNFEKLPYNKSNNNEISTSVMITSVETNQ